MSKNSGVLVNMATMYEIICGSYVGRVELTFV
jgi:hypothetical protein